MDYVGFILFFCLSTGGAIASSSVYNVDSFGAKGDGRSRDTEASIMLLLAIISHAV